MTKTLIAIMALSLAGLAGLAGCSVNYSPTEITFSQTVSGEGKGTMKTDAKGLTTV